ncbi:MAG: hypothetical protein U1A77_13725 [Pirellulales bacterium]
MSIDSSSVGDPLRFVPFETLTAGLESLATAPQDEGRVTRIMARGRRGERQLLDSTTVTPEAGVPGDAWGRDAQRIPEAQIAVMQEDVANLIANGQPLELSGDNLWLDMDLRAENLPPGTRLRIGKEAEFEVTPEPHDGCRKFRSRFGPDALRFVSDKSQRHRNLRGIYLRVMRSGEIHVGDLVKKL